MRAYISKDREGKGTHLGESHKTQQNPKNKNAKRSIKYKDKLHRKKIPQKSTLILSQKEHFKEASKSNYYSR